MVSSNGVHIVGRSLYFWSTEISVKLGSFDAKKILKFVVGFKNAFKMLFGVSNKNQDLFTVHIVLCFKIYPYKASKCLLAHSVFPLLPFR